MATSQQLRGGTNKNNTPMPPIVKEEKLYHNNNTATTIDNRRILDGLSDECNPPYPHWIGDGYCDNDYEYNTAACNWDGGEFVRY